MSDGNTVQVTVDELTDEQQIGLKFLQLMNILIHYKPGDRSPKDRHVARTINHLEDSYANWQTFVNVEGE